MMDRNKGTEKRMPIRFLLDILRGVCIGIAFIIPGFSGGSIAAVLGIYERMIDAVVGIFTSFKKSVSTLLPIGIGMGIGAVSLLFPIKWALGIIPLPTVSLFVGLTLGCMPTLTKFIKGRFTISIALSFALPAVLTSLLMFLPLGKDVDLYTLTVGGYLLLIVVGFIASSALVIPGISGSMLMLMLGYYNPTVSMITELLDTLKNLIFGNDTSPRAFFITILVLGIMAVGMVGGFMFISVIIKKLLKSKPRHTYAAIIGFIVGSIPAVYASTVKDAGYTAATLPSSPLYWIACPAALILGAFISLIIVIYANKKNSAE